MLNDYKLVKKLGEGSTAEVWEAHNQKDQSKCALKIFNTETNPDLNDLLKNEIYHSSRLQHKNTVNMYAAEEEAILENADGSMNKVSYIASELFTKGELFYYLADKDGLPAPIVRHYGKQLIDALRHMHDKGVAHRDLKCENILMDDEYNLKISDFGFACPISGRRGRGYSSEHVGSNQYMAPELQMGVQYQPQTVDWYAFAVILFMLYSGRAPFVEATLSDPHFKLLAAHDSAKFWRAHSADKEDGFFSEDFKNLITQLLAY